MSDPEEYPPAPDSLSMERTSLMVEASDEGDIGIDFEGRKDADR